MLIRESSIKPIDLLKSRLTKLSKLSSSNKNRLNRYSMFRLTGFLAATSYFIITYTLKPSHFYWYIPGFLLILAFVYFVAKHKSFSVFGERLENLTYTLEREKKRAELRIEDMYEGDPVLRDLTDKQNFYNDLGLFGKNGLYTFLNTTGTKEGHDNFLKILLRQNPETTPDILERQEDVKKMSSHPYLTLKLLRILSDRTSGESHKRIQLSLLYDPDIAFFKYKKVLSVFFKPYVISSWFISVVLYLSDLPSFSALFFTINTVLYIRNARETRKKLALLRPVQENIKILVKAGKAISFLSESFSEKRESLGKILSDLSKILSRVSIQDAPLPHFLLNSLFLWDLWQIKALEKWVFKNGNSIRLLCETIEKADTLLPFANFKWHNPESEFPVIDDSLKKISADKIEHPLIDPDKRVGNPLSPQEQGEALIITGSNMSGKTTYLRTIGVNSLLALCGSSVTAKNFKLPNMEILTSIKNEDSLQEGISFFYAEVKRITYILNKTTNSGNFIILLDELLKGTNTRERLIASKVILEKLVKTKSFVFITTHDIDLAKKHKHFSLAHFTEVLSDRGMGFDYKIRKGVIQSTNALKILKMENPTLKFPG